jgi:hypothetical protein
MPFQWVIVGGNGGHRYPLLILWKQIIGSMETKVKRFDPDG